MNTLEKMDAVRDQALSAISPDRDKIQRLMLLWWESSYRPLSFDEKAEYSILCDEGYVQKALQHIETKHETKDKKNKMTFYDVLFEKEWASKPLPKVIRLPQLIHWVYFTLRRCLA